MTTKQQKTIDEQMIVIRAMREKYHDLLDESLYWQHRYQALMDVIKELVR